MSSHVAAGDQVTLGLDRRSELSEFLRSRRARLRPEDVGLPSYGRRRVPGLRREELAQLAGVSYAYYARLEQGHGETMSAEVLDAVAGVLRLNEEERDHLIRLAQPERQSTTQAVPPPQRLRPSVQHLLDALSSSACEITGNRARTPRWAAASDIRTSAPMRRPPRRVTTISRSGRPLMSTSVRGRSTVSRIRSTSVVPPAM